MGEGRESMSFQVLKTINNNVVSCQDEHGCEYIAMGRGLGFGVKAGQTIEREQAEKMFRITGRDNMERLSNLFASLPHDQVEFCTELIEYASKAPVSYTHLDVYKRQGQDDGVHAGALQKFQPLGQSGYLLVAGHGVAGDVDPHPPAVAELHRLTKLLRSEVAGEGAHAEHGPRQIDGVGPVGHRHLQPDVYKRQGQ